MLYAKAGTCVAKCQPGYALDSATGICKACTGTTYSDIAGATSCTSCPTATALKDRVRSYVYYDADHSLHDTIEQCRAFLIEDDARGDYALACFICNGDYGVGTCGNRKCMAMHPSSCSAGYRWAREDDDGVRGVWAATIDELKPLACLPVGAGYYSPDGDTDATACPAGTTTIGYGAGADEAADCGVALHVGDATVHLRSAKRTTPSLHVRVGNQTFYGDMTTTTKGRIRIRIGNTVYSVYDDSM